MRRGASPSTAQSSFSEATSRFPAAWRALFEHSSLPWCGSPVADRLVQPLTEATSPGERHAQSILAQYAAHLALLKFASVDDGEFDPADWVVVRERSKDPRLIRISPPRKGTSDSLDLLRRCAAILHVEKLESFAQTWIRPEGVYREIHRALSEDIAADLRWLLDSATGRILSPGVELFDDISKSGGAIAMRDDAAATAMARAISGTPLVIGTAASPLKRYSAFTSVVDLAATGAETEAVVAEKFAAMADSKCAIAVVNSGSFDSSSWRAIALAFELLPNATWFAGPHRGEVPFRKIALAPADRWFVLSPTLRSAAEIEAELSGGSPEAVRAFCSAFTHSEKFAAYLDDGVLSERLPRQHAAPIPEPRRSYLSALALLGDRFERAVAQRYLERLGCALPVVDVCGDAADFGDEIVFRDPSLRASLVESMDKPMRAALARVATEAMGSAGDRVVYASLLIECGDTDDALRVIEQELATSRGVIAQVMSVVPAQTLCRSPRLATEVARESIRRGSYRAARDAALAAESPERELLLAQVHRRRGEYREALRELETIPVEARSFESQILEAELLRLEGNVEKAVALLDRTETIAETPRERARVDYERALIAIDRGAAVNESMLAGVSADPYLRSRLQTYAAIASDDYAGARERASVALEIAATSAERIDVQLDLFYADFMSGEWERARHQALVTLAEVEETDGDRAAVGVLYTLAYLYADSGQFAQSRAFVERMRQFHARSRDDRRLRELALITAQEALVAMRLEEAEATARTLVDNSDVPSTIRDAAALIVDEVAVMRGSSPAWPRESKCVELRNRQILLQCICRNADERNAATMTSGYTRDLARWVVALRDNPSAPHPEPADDGAALRLLRVAIALDAREPSDAIASLVNELRSRFAFPVAAAERQNDHAPAVAALCDLAARPFPPDDKPLGSHDWCYASRNRLGKWTRYGSASKPGDDDFERSLAAPAGDWMRCGENGVLFVHGSSSWPLELRQALSRTCEMRFENMRLKRAIDQESAGARDVVPMNQGWIGESAAMIALQATIAKVAQRDVSVCIIGESGTGKELAARAIHRNSARRSRPFTPINCAALPENLVESELFGHAKGAFTGADRDRSGLIETTEGGTLFLDEIGEMPLPAQAKLLRFLQEREFRRVGESAIRHADVRVVAATNRKLEQAVDGGTFREDLYYRLRGIELAVPPLRERGRDILLIARHVLDREREQHRRGAVRFSEEVEQAMLSYDWPGNVRELENTVRAAHALAGDVREIALEHLPERVRSAPKQRHASGSFFDEVSRFRRSLIEQSLIDAQGNQNRAAAQLGMSRQALGYQIRELGIVVGTKRK